MTPCSAWTRVIMFMSPDMLDEAQRRGYGDLLVVDLDEPIGHGTGSKDAVICVDTFVMVTCTRSHSSSSWCAVRGPGALCTGTGPMLFLGHLCQTQVRGGDVDAGSSIPGVQSHVFLVLFGPWPGTDTSRCQHHVKTTTTTTTKGVSLKCSRTRVSCR